LIEKILGILATFIIATISKLGYAGIALLMAIESACIPLPSEVIMPFAGYLVSTGQMKLWVVGLMGAIGCVLGSIVAYYVGAYGGRAMIVRYGKYVLVSTDDLDLADRWFRKYGDITVFVARLLPVIRTFIAFPAGVSRMPMGRFIIYTFIGSYIWSYGLAYIGMKLGENWDSLKVYFHRFDFVIAIILLGGAAWWIRRHFRNRVRESETVPVEE
jgi:membrane protein DedA with SNARE-associated domain